MANVSTREGVVVEVEKSIDETLVLAVHVQGKWHHVVVDAARFKKCIFRWYANDSTLGATGYLLRVEVRLRVVVLKIYKNSRLARHDIADVTLTFNKAELQAVVGQLVG